MGDGHPPGLSPPRRADRQRNPAHKSTATIETDQTVKEGIVNVQRLLMDSHDFQATGDGIVGFDHTLNLKVKLNLSQLLSQKITGSFPAARLALIGSRLNVPLLITGTLKRRHMG